MIMRLCLFLCFCCFLEAIDFRDFDSYQETCSKEEVELKIKKYLLKDEEIRSYFHLSDEALVLYESPKAKEIQKEEYKIKFGHKLKKTVSPKRQDLKGVKIAIDPGHFGGRLAKLEKRFIEIDAGEKEGVFSFNEGTLTLLTALYLKDLLTNAGANVLLTRTEEGVGALEISFETWLESLPSKHKDPALLFKEEYNLLDLRKRTSIINQFAPDLTLILHFNAHDAPDHVPTTDKNYNMVFLPGSFCKYELADRQSRYEFIRLLVTEDIEESEKLCSNVIFRLNEYLAVPSVSETDGVRYLKNSSIEIAQGVYARNLCLTRLVHGPLCYGETLIQNNTEECRRLAMDDTDICGRKAPSRLKEIAKAYFAAICDYFGVDQGKNL